MSTLIQKAIEDIRKMPNLFDTYVVGMSGGVDSSVSAFLLKEAGFKVIGCFMKNWEEKDIQGHCTQEDDFRDVTAVARILDIPSYTLNFTKEYKEEVFAHFLEDLQKGLTPNPDVLCNREIKFKRLLEKALTLGNGGLATGHYAQIGVDPSGSFLLQKPKDRGKDQTYFLYTITQHALKYTLFPLATLLKKDVRAIAKEINLPVHDKKDSTGICFIGEREFRSFLSQWIGTKPGPMRTPEGRVVGEHMGLAYYTIGQRKGMNIGGTGPAWFVVQKNVDTNELIVVQGEKHPLLFAPALLAKDVHWIGQAPSFPFTCRAKIRYRQPDQACTVTETDGTLHVAFDEPQRAITPQQAIVFYDGDTCLGGGTIIRSM